MLENVNKQNIEIIIQDYLYIFIKFDTDEKDQQGIPCWLLLIPMNTRYVVGHSS